jgi:pheromone shutdown protein TraB
MSEPDVEPETSFSMPDPGGSDEGNVHLVGTAHVSEHSVEEVEQEIRERRPGVVAVELDEGRYRQMRGETPDDIEPSDLLRGNTVFQFLAYWMLSYVQSRLGERFDVEPGADMKAAVDTADEVGVGVALVDRDIQVTIQRFWKRMTLVEKLRMIAGLAFGVASPTVVGVTAGMMIGFFLGPLVGVGTALSGSVEAATMSRIVAGGLSGGFVGYLLYELGFRTGSEDRGIALAAIGGTATAGVVVALGLGAGLVGGLLGGTVLYLVGGVTVGLAIGLGFGSVVAAYLAATGDEAELDEEFDIEELTDGDVVTAMMEEFRRFSPGGAEALIDERDAYIAHKLVSLRNQGHDVLAVVGAGHKDGIEEFLEHPDRLPPFESLVGETSSRRFSVFKLFGYLVTVGFVGFFVLLILGGASNELLLKVFGTWFLFNGVFAFGLAKLAGARWLSATVGGAVAWMTSINPLLAPGWFAGYVELRYTPVNVADIATLNEIIADQERPIRQVVGDMFDVPLFKLIMVVALTNVGSVIASWLYPLFVLPMIAPEGDIGEVADLLIRGARNGLDIVLGLI